MSQQPLSNRFLAGAFTFMGLGLVWITIINNLPSQQELSAKESPPSPAQSVSRQATPEPVLDLSIPGVPPPSSATKSPRSSARVEVSPTDVPMDGRVAQVARLRCEAEIEQLCPEASDGFGRRQCLQKRAQQLSTPCQQQVRERAVRWKEERSQFRLACQADINRFCSEVRPGGRPTVQCLQQHVQELSDGCYGMLPKGTLHFKQ
jgi:hypothetical protein